MSAEHNRMALSGFCLGGGGESFNIMYGPRGLICRGENVPLPCVARRLVYNDPISRSNRFFME